MLLGDHPKAADMYRGVYILGMEWAHYSACLTFVVQILVFDQRVLCCGVHVLLRGFELASAVKPYSKAFCNTFHNIMGKVLVRVGLEACLPRFLVQGGIDLG